MKRVETAISRLKPDIDGKRVLEKTLSTLIRPVVTFENGRKWTHFSDSFENGRIWAQ